MFSHNIVYMLARAANGALVLASMYFFTRWLSADEYGKYAMEIAVALVGSAIFYQWLQVATARFYPDWKDNVRPLLGQCVWLFSSCTVVMALLALSLWPLAQHYGIDGLQVAYCAALVILMGAHNLASQLANVMQRPSLYGYLNNLRALVALLAGLWLIHWGWGWQGAVVGALLGFAAALLIFIGFLAHAGLLAAEQGSTDTATRHSLRAGIVRYGIPLSLTFTAAIVVDLSDRLLLGALGGAGAVAGYAASYDLAQQSMGVVMNVVFISGYPFMLSAMAESEAHEIQRHWRSIGTGLLVVGGFAAALLVGAASDICTFMLGAAIRADGARIMPVVAVAVLLACFKSYFLDLAFHVEKQTSKQVNIAITMAVANVLANLLLIPRMGGLGAAFATLLAFALGAVLSWRLGGRIVAYPDMSAPLLKSVIACLTTILALAGVTAGPGLLGVGSKVLLAASIYGLVALAVDLAGIRVRLAETVRKYVKAGISWR